MAWTRVSIRLTAVTRVAVSWNASAPGIELSLAEMHPDVALSQRRVGAINVAARPGRRLAAVEAEAREQHDSTGFTLSSVVATAFVLRTVAD
jgi:hypothetical protein